MKPAAKPTFIQTIMLIDLNAFYSVRNPHRKIRDNVSRTKFGQFASSTFKKS